MPTTTGIEVRSRGHLLDGTAPVAVRRASRRWLQGTLTLVRDFGRSIAPVLTGRFKGSIRYRTRDGAGGVEGEVYSDDVPGKVKVIERGFPPARAGLKGRVGRYVFKRSFDRFHGLLASQEHVLVAEYQKELG